MTKIDVTFHPSGVGAFESEVLLFVDSGDAPVEITLTGSRRAE